MDSRKAQDKRSAGQKGFERLELDELKVTCRVRYRGHSASQMSRIDGMSQNVCQSQMVGFTIYRQVSPDIVPSTPTTQHRLAGLMKCSSDEVASRPVAYSWTCVCIMQVELGGLNPCAYHSSSLTRNGGTSWCEPMTRPPRPVSEEYFHKEEGEGGAITRADRLDDRPSMI